MDPIFASSKRVKEGNILHQEIVDQVDCGKIAEVIDRLEILPKASRLRLDELELRVNAKKWANLILQAYPSKKQEEMDYLLQDFTDAMRTRMREDSKYAIGLVMQDRLVLCHSFYGEETITPDWKIIPRMLDSDNVLRYVCFLNEKGVATVRFWEREATSSFIEWLGLPRKQAFLFGGRYGIYCEIEGLNTELQLTDQEMEKWLESHAELREGMIRFSSPIVQLNISEIRMGRRRYERPEDFVQDYEAEKHGIPRMQRDYEKINSTFEPLLFRYYDEKTQVVRAEGDAMVVEVAKPSSDFDILFANHHIQLRSSYLGDIVNRFVNGETIKVVHAGVRFRTPAYNVGGASIYNAIQLDQLTQFVVKYYNGANLQDAKVARVLECAIFRMLATANSESPLSHFFIGLSSKILELAVPGRKFAKAEDDVLEYKSRDEFVGSNDDIVQRLAEDLDTKLRASPCKIYLIGVEDDGGLHPIASSRLKSDRVEAIRKGLQDQLGTSAVYVCPLIEQEGGILVVAALKQ